MSTNLKQIDATTWEIPRQGAMRVPGRIIASEELLPKIRDDKAAEQVANVACLSGIVGYALAMPDAHWGYGFPIGGVAATDPDEGGVVSPGGVGYDINCGVRLMTTCVQRADVAERVGDVVRGLYRDIPCGIGSEGAIPKLRQADLNAVLEKGAAWAAENGFGSQADLEHTEERGCMPGADAKTVSDRAKSRGQNQLGTLGSGNHFAELGVVGDVFDASDAEAYGLEEGALTLMIHSGSRGLGYQVCDDFLHVMTRAAAQHGIKLPDRQLCCAPVHSRPGMEYLAAMACAANYAWANRQIMMSLAQRSMAESLGMSDRDLGMSLLYDVCHNIAKFEMHDVGGTRKRLCVHRKGATRAFPASRGGELPQRYRQTGQPVLVPGDMGTESYVLAAQEPALGGAKDEFGTFGSCCHGAGRVMSRTAARKARRAEDLFRELEGRGIVLMARSKKTVAEEAPGAYKDVSAVAEVVERAGIAHRVARIRPVGVVKG